MESYSVQLERECWEMAKEMPLIEKIVNAVLGVNRMSGMEFDYEIERQHLMYRKVKELLLNENKFGN